MTSNVRKTILKPALTIKTQFRVHAMIINKKQNKQFNLALLIDLQYTRGTFF